MNSKNLKLKLKVMYSRTVTLILVMAVMTVMFTAQALENSDSTTSPAKQTHSLTTLIDEATSQTASEAKQIPPRPPQFYVPKSNLEYVYLHFYYNYDELSQLPQYYEDLFAMQGRLPTKRWLEYYTDRLTRHEAAFHHIYLLVEEPDYSLNDFISTGTLYGTAPASAPLIALGAERIQVYGRMGLMFGDMFLAQGDYDRAIRCYDLVVRMTKIDPDSPMLLHLLSIQIRQLAYNHMALALDQFSDIPAAALSLGMRETLEKLKERLLSYRSIEEQHSYESILRGELLDFWATMAWYEKTESPLPNTGLRAGWKAAFDRYIPLWESGRVPDTILMVSGRRKNETLMKLSTDLENLKDETLFVRDFGAGAHREILEVRIKLASAFWKLIYLETIAILDPDSADSLAELRYFIPSDSYPYMMIDPFTGLVFGKYPNDAKQKSHYYSFGPDRDDDAGKIIYNPANGTISDGDVPLFY